MEQTGNAEEIASFFLQQATIQQLVKTQPLVVKTLSNQLCDKLAYNDKGDDKGFKERMCQCICAQLTGPHATTVSPDTLRWLIDTPLLEPVLLKLQQQGIDISPITQSLTSWQIADFSDQDIKQLLTPEECQRLFKQAFKLRQAETMSRLLLTGHCDQLTNLLSDSGASSLHCFAHCGILSGLIYLLKLKNTEVNKKDNDGWTPLDCAARYDHKECLKALLNEPGILINEKTNDGWTPLNFAARNGHTECLKALLNAPDILVNEKNNDGWTPLNCAARYGHTECLKALLKAPGILINEKNNDGWTPLNCAARYGHTECLKALLNAPSRVLSLNNVTPWIVTLLKGSSILCALNRHISPVEPIVFMLPFQSRLRAHNSYINQAEHPSGILVNEKNNDGWTPLNCAARNGHTKCLEALLNAHDINVNEKNKDGWTPLNCAARNGYTKCLEALLKAPDIKVNEKNNDGWTPLNYAARYGHTECQEALLKAPGILVNGKNNDG